MIRIFIITLFFSGNALVGYTNPPIDKTQANNILIRTNRVIGHAHMSVKNGKKFTGDFAKSVHHERVAKAYYKSGEYEKAIYHSRLARMFATDAIKANKVRLPMDAAFSPAEQQLFTEAPTKEELEKEAMIKDPEKIEDKDLMNGNLNIDLNN